MKKPDEILSDFRNKIATIPDKQKKVCDIIDFAIIYSDSYGNKIIPLIEEAITLAKEIKFEEGEIASYFNLYFVSAVTQSGVKSEYLYTIQELALMVEKVKHAPEWYSFTLNFLSYYYWFKGEYEKGFDLAFEGVRYSEINNVSNRGWHYFALAVYYFDTKDFDNSKLNYQKAFELFEQENITYGKARSATGLGTTAIIQNRNEEALPLLEYAAGIYREFGHYSGLSRVLNDMGLLEKTKGDHKKAISFYEESIELRKEINHVQGLITSYTDLGETYLHLKDHSAALQEFKKGLSLAQQANSQQKQMRLHKLLYDTYKALNETQSALENFEMFYELKTKLLSDEASNNIKKIQTKYEKEKSEKEAEIERFRNIELKKAYSLIEQKNEELNQQNEEIAAQRDEIEIQKRLIEDHQKDTIDSINYAKRIQDAILPPTELIRRKLPGSYVLYKPKDIVAGDFYWMEEVNGTILIAAADCTGHGVPGAMVSVVCSNALNRAVKEFHLSEPGKILDKVTDLVIETFEKSAADVKDGMDISLLSIEYKDGRNEKPAIKWSGANNPLWYFNEKGLNEITADKQPIGNSDHRKDFKTHTINYAPGTIFYLFTDGYADQFGGPKGKKFKYKQFQQTLSTLSEKEPASQHGALDEIFETWKGKLEQVDDVCVIGIRL